MNPRGEHKVKEKFIRITKIVKYITIRSLLDILMDI